jgi:hypothetical protein
MHDQKMSRKDGRSVDTPMGETAAESRVVSFSAETGGALRPIN